MPKHQSGVTGNLGQPNAGGVGTAVLDAIGHRARDGLELFLASRASFYKAYNPAHIPTPPMLELPGNRETVPGRFDD